MASRSDSVNDVYVEINSLMEKISKRICDFPKLCSSEMHKEWSDEKSSWYDNRKGLEKILFDQHKRSEQLLETISSLEKENQELLTSLCNASDRVSEQAKMAGVDIGPGSFHEAIVQQVAKSKDSLLSMLETTKEMKEECAANVQDNIKFEKSVESERLLLDLLDASDTDSCSDSGSPKILESEAAETLDGKCGDDNHDKAVDESMEVAANIGDPGNEAEDDMGFPASQF